VILALVDQLRALPPPLALAVLAQLEAELGPEAVGALETAWEFWRRPAQRFPRSDERPAVVVYTGGYGTGKTRTACELLTHMVLTGRAKGPRILAATGADARDIVENARTGILAWKKPGVAYDWQSSKGFEGELGVNGVKIGLFSVDAPRSALGVGADVQLLDDPPKWGPTGKAAFVAALKSSRERGSLTIIPTTEDGLALLREVLGDDLVAAGVLVIDLGPSEANAGNLDPNYFKTKAALDAQGLWNPIGSSSPWAKLTPAQWRAMRLDACPPLVELCVSIDPNKGGTTRPCEVGIIGGGRDARSTVHTRHDRSAVLDSGVSGWPKVAWDLAVELQEDNPGVPWHFVFETNVGKDRAEPLRAEERARRRRGERVPLPRGGWADADNRSEVSACEFHWIRADRDKCRRAEMPAHQAAQGQVKHAPGLDKLEGQQRNLTPTGTDSDGADAENHMITDLAGLGEKAAAEGVTAEEAADQCAIAATLTARLASRGRPTQPVEVAPGILEPMKVEGALPGDSRYAGPHRGAGRAPTWRTRGAL
jgi:phage terminase large subunit-like protein